MKQTVFTGAGVAIVTPFTADNKINYEKLAELLEYQIANQTHGAQGQQRNGQYHQQRSAQHGHNDTQDFLCSFVHER